MDNFDLQAYLTRGVERLVADSLRAALKNPKESAFLLRFAGAAKKASDKRGALEKEGLHVPPYLICSITSRCNLHCAGCYSRCEGATVDAEPVRQLTAPDWDRIFGEAEELGLSYLLLAGGEPMLRGDVIEAAGTHPGLLFPIFTNGTFLDEHYLKLLDRCRNLIPVLSIEGGREATDARRGDGIYDLLLENMEKLTRRGILFGASVTVTTENLAEVFSEDFVASLTRRGCKLVVYVEYVPVGEDDSPLAPGDPEREQFRADLARLRAAHPETVFVSFPGDEKSSGGCVAAGRGLFHINSHGGAEPCPFSPYSDVNVRETSLREALDSPLFHAIQAGGLLAEEHAGGCVLHQRRAEVEALLAAK